MLLCLGGGVLIAIGAVGVDGVSALPRATEAFTSTTSSAASTSTSTATSSTRTSTTATRRTVPPPAPTTTTSTGAPPDVPPYGQATVTGCAAALTYLRIYAAPEFSLVCPGPAQGAQALTCYGEAPCASGQRMVVIADPCPAAYMNEAHNSWVLKNEVEGTPIPDGNPRIDPYGHC